MMEWSFLRAVELLDKEKHRSLRLGKASDVGFLANIRDCHLMVDEYFEAAKHAPVVFARDADGSLYSVMVMGFPGGKNLFVNAEGKWHSGVYMPAYLRRYPFVALESEGEFFLGIDREHPGFNETEGEPLFDEAGQAGELIQAATNFMNEFLESFRLTQAFLAELDRLQLLRPFETEVVAEGKQYKLGNMLYIDRIRLGSLSSCERMDFLERGYQNLAVAHLMSLTNFDKMLSAWG